MPIAMTSQYFTKEGLEKLKQEYEHRTTGLREEIAARLKEAKELGDLSENFEFAEAKDAQAMNENRIEEIRLILENAVIFSDSEKSTGVVTVGSEINVKSSKNGTQVFRIVGAAESNPLQGLISNESPLGAAFLGKKKGETVTASTPKGEVQYKILDIK